MSFHKRKKKVNGSRSGLLVNFIRFKLPSPAPIRNRYMKGFRLHQANLQLMKNVARMGEWVSERVRLTTNPGAGKERCGGEKDRKRKAKEKRDELNWARVNIFTAFSTTRKPQLSSCEEKKRWKNKNEIKNYVYCAMCAPLPQPPRQAMKEIDILCFLCFAQPFKSHWIVMEVW